MHYSPRYVFIFTVNINERRVGLYILHSVNLFRTARNPQNYEIKCIMHNNVSAAWGKLSYTF